MEVEHHLRRGRPLAAFSSLLYSRVHTYTPPSGRQYSSYDSQNFLSTLTESEESLIASVRYCSSRVSRLSVFSNFCLPTLKAIYV